MQAKKNARRGPSKSIWTPANIVTTVRVALMPLWLLLAEFSSAATDKLSISALMVAILYIIISLTDKLDGYLARSRGEVTEFGQFLDPIADKLAVVVALCYLLEIGQVNSWVLLIIIAREFLVSGLRMVVASAGVVVPASNLGKWKTAITMIAICSMLWWRAFPSTVDPHHPVNIITMVLMLVALMLTAWSGIDYFVKCWPYVSGSRKKGKR